jgi:hypothetical protein
MNEPDHEVNFNVDRLSKLLDSAPGPSPWAFRDIPAYQTSHGPLTWFHVGNRRMALVDAQKQKMLLTDYYVYAQPTSETEIIFWAERPRMYDPDRRTGSIEMYVLNLNGLLPISGDDALFSDMNAKNSRFVFEAGLLESCDIPISLPMGKSHFRFPARLASVSEILVLAQNISQGRDERTMTQCIYCLKPQEGTIEVIPQEWFNQGQFDFGYEWITAVARDPLSGRIVGKGMRIGRFVLDATGRQRSKQF